MQHIIKSDYSDLLQKALREKQIKKYLLVCDAFCLHTKIFDLIDGIKKPAAIFTGFSSNPKYQEVCNGLNVFTSNNCDGIIVIGGGSAIDVAKCIKLFSALDKNKNFLDQPFVSSDLPLIAVPTTAGTGSESTKYAVIYSDGVKQSITHESIIPDVAVLYPEVLDTLPVFQKKCTMMDALCQAIESRWSVNSTDESISYSKMAIRGIIENYKSYIFDYNTAAANAVMTAANLAGRAINITQTTAAHAMSYKITSVYGLPHGYAVAICLPFLWEFMNEHIDRCTDVRGSEYLYSAFCDISKDLGYESIGDAIGGFKGMLDELSLTPPVRSSYDEILMLARSVNIIRLKNNPIIPTGDELAAMYDKIIN